MSGEDKVSIGDGPSDQKSPFKTLGLSRLAKEGGELDPGGARRESLDTDSRIHRKSGSRESLDRHGEGDTGPPVVVSPAEVSSSQTDNGH